MALNPDVDYSPYVDDFLICFDLRSPNHSFNLCWIPSHIGISGNP